MIKPSQQVLLDAIKASLFGNVFTYPDDTDWEEVIKEAKLQTVLGLISSVIPVHDESIARGKAYYMQLLHEQEKLLKLLEVNNISCVILKGCAAAIYYPKPYLRSMGDVDFLVRHDQFEDAMKLMESNGYVCIEGKGEDGRLKEGARHLGYEKNGIEFELHHHFSSPGYDIDDILEKAIDKREYRNLNGYSFPVLPEIENGLVLLGHINQHLTLDNLGLRQIIDWEMYCNAVLNGEKYENDFKPIADEFGLWKLADNVTRMCEKHLGLPKTRVESQNDLIKDIIEDDLIESLLDSGNFGRKLVANSGDRISSVSSAIKKKGLYSYFQDNGLETWKLCKEYPVFKPIAFIYGFFRFLVRGAKGIINGGKLKEQIGYVKKKNRINNDLGLRTGVNKKR